MIKSLHIVNSESHKDTLLNFSPGLNVFIGESDRGKSGVFRAYNLLTRNEPGGDWMFPLYWDGTTEITGEFLDPDCIVTRRKGKSINEYTLNDEDPVNAGTSVPSNIATLLNIDDVNFQAQIDRAFLMFETAGERGRILNRISGLDEIDQTLDNAKSDVAALTLNQKAIKKDIEEFTKALQKFEKLGEMEAALESVENKHSQKEAGESRLETLKKIQNSVFILDNLIEKKEAFLKCQERIKAIQEVKAIADEYRKRIRIMKEIQESMERITKRESGKSFEGFHDRVQSINDLKKKAERARLEIQQLQFFKKDLEEIEEDIQEKEKEIKELKSKMPKSCPECGRPM